MTGTIPRINDVRGWIEETRKFAYQCLKQNVLEHRFMKDLSQGTLPRDKLQEFFRQWYSFALEVNTSMGTLYHRFNALTRRLPELEDILTDKIADEFGNPGPGGHIRTLEATAQALGVSRDEMAYAKLSPHARAFCDFTVRITLEGTIGEYATRVCFIEGQAFYFSGAFRKALATHYLPRERDHYFGLHEEADSEPHGGHMGHGEAAERLVELLVENDEFKFRPGFSPEYIIATVYKLRNLLFDDICDGLTYEKLLLSARAQ